MNNLLSAALRQMVSSLDDWRTCCSKLQCRVLTNLMKLEVPHRTLFTAKRPFFILAVLLPLEFTFAFFGCAVFHGPGYDRRASSLADPPRRPGATLFQKSLHESYEDLYDLEKVRQWVMYYLLGELAGRDGPNSAKYNLLTELDTLHVAGDAPRLADIYDEGLAELDRTPDSLGRNDFVEREVTNRARQILQLHCFKPEAICALDALGQLIALHGTCRIETWNETTMIVEFPNGWMYWVGEDAAYDHTILRVGRDRSDLTRLSNKARGKADETADEELTYDEDLYQYTDVGMLAESKIPEMEQQREVSIYVDYEPIDIATVNVHPVPTCFGDGRWNGRSVGAVEGPWDWTRLFVDIFVNRGELTTAMENANHVDLQIDYTIYRHNDSSPVYVLGENLAYRQNLGGVGKNDGIMMRAVTAPFFTAADSCQGHYLLNLSISDGVGKAIQKVPFHIAERHYELMVIEETLDRSIGIPVCPRTPSVEAPGSLKILVPVKGLQYSESEEAYLGKLDIYLIDNRDRKQGTVRLGEMFASDFGDTTGATLAPPLSPSEEQAPPPALIASFDLKESHPDEYVKRLIQIPSSLTDGTRVKRGTYTLGALVSAGGETITEAVMNNLHVQ